MQTIPAVGPPPEPESMRTRWRFSQLQSPSGVPPHSRDEAEGVMPKATWNGAVLAESDRTVVVEGNHYFPPDAIRAEYFKPSDTHTACGWKGTASYYTLEVNGKQNPDAAWYYPDPKEAAKNIAGYVA